MDGAKPSQDCTTASTSEREREGERWLIVCIGNTVDFAVWCGKTILVLIHRSNDDIYLSVFVSSGCSCAMLVQLWLP